MIRSLVVVLLLFFGCFYFAPDIMNFLSQPLLEALPSGTKPIWIDQAGAFFTLTKIAFLTALLLVAALGALPGVGLRRSRPVRAREEVRAAADRLQRVLPRGRHRVRLHLRAAGRLQVLHRDVRAHRRRDPAGPAEVLGLHARHLLRLRADLRGAGGGDAAGQGRNGQRRPAQGRPTLRRGRRVRGRRGAHAPGRDLAVHAGGARCACSTSSASSSRASSRRAAGHRTPKKRRRRRVRPRADRFSPGRGRRVRRSARLPPEVSWSAPASGACPPRCSPRSRARRA